MNQEYKELSRQVYYRLYSKDLSREDGDYIREEFVKNLYRVLRHAVKISVTEDDLNQFLSGKANNPSESDIEQFGAYLLEKDRSYELVNEFYRRFIEIYDSEKNRTPY